MSLPFQFIAFYFKLESEQNWTELKSARVLLAQKNIWVFWEKNVFNDKLSCLALLYQQI